MRASTPRRGTEPRGASRGRGVPRAGSAPRARARFGQHFLEPAWVVRLLDRLAPAERDTFLEIGPGRGALTRPLAERVERLVCVEIDRDLVAALEPTLPPSATIVAGDVLRIDLAALIGRLARPIRVVGNLPYNVSSPILFALVGAADAGAAIADATLMLQREVAERLVAAPGRGEYGTLAVQCGLVADVESLLTLPPGAFRPPPQVTSTLVRLRFRPPSHAIGSPGTFERIVRGVFLQRRKMLANALKPVAASLGTSVGALVERSGVDPSKRPQDLSIADFASLARAVL
jgi:16S rRNA (adenine1518-N6/adenine1519-N6)-dimethyltransferase